jgi:hypothetical protein
LILPKGQNNKKLLISIIFTQPKKKWFIDGKENIGQTEIVRVFVDIRSGSRESVKASQEIDDSDFAPPPLPSVRKTL